MPQCDLDVLQAALQLALRLGQRLAAFPRSKLRDLVEVLFQQSFELEEVLHALKRRRPAPISESCLGGAHRLVHVFTRRERHAHDGFSSRGIAHILEFTAARAFPCSAYVVQQLSILNHGCFPLPAYSLSG